MPSTCSNNATLNDNRTLCEGPSHPAAGTFTANACYDENGIALSTDGTGTSASLIACEGTPTGNKFNMYGGNADSQSLCEGTPTGMQYLNAAVVDLSGNNILTQSIHVIEVATTILLS